MALSGRKRSSSSFGNDGRRIKLRKSFLFESKISSSLPLRINDNKPIQPKAKVLIQRAPVLSFLSTPTGSGLQKKFQRPMTKRRAYNKI
eukprot:CAMPEP_0194151590 /NCGR_PEP_ID=MMETSP0152-20130528/48826_1 /TAXON_ID=1049557 /ORGANISM="Thalassiothrix antarctica, Strain L6-D1" /LENGTH=88 /DNA_ID=CAMNT_0038855505 /DNA_START=17 /DNA_END=280 /DNA_ORIENTATION=+